MNVPKVKTENATYPADSLFFLLDALFQTEDLKIGVQEIASCIYPVVDKKAIRAVYFHLEKHKCIPASKWGSMWCARKSVIRARMWVEEMRGFTDAEQRMVRIYLLLSAALRLIPANATALSRLAQDEAQLLGLLAEAAQTIRPLVKLEQ